MASTSANLASKARRDSEKEIGFVLSRYVARRAELTNQISYDSTCSLTQRDDVASLRERSRHKNTKIHPCNSIVNDLQ